MALSVGNDLTTLLLGAVPPEAAPRRGAGPALTQPAPSGDTAVDFAGLLAAASGDAPRVEGNPVAPDLVQTVPAARSAGSPVQAMPWDMLAAAAEETGALAAAFQLPPGMAPSASAPLPVAVPEMAEDMPAPAEPADQDTAPLPIVPLVPFDAKISDLDQTQPALVKPAPAAVPAHAAEAEDAVAAPVQRLQKSAAPPAIAASAAPSPVETGAAPQEPAVRQVEPTSLPPPVPSAAISAAAPMTEQAAVQAAPALANIGPSLPKERSAPVPAAAVGHDIRKSQPESTPAGPSRPMPQPAAEHLPQSFEPIAVAAAPIREQAAPAAPLTAEFRPEQAPVAAPLSASREPAQPVFQPLVAPVDSQSAEAPRAGLSTSASHTTWTLRPQQAAEARQQLVFHAAAAAKDGVETISVDLRPPELGRVELRLTFREGTVQVAMAAERAETFEALRQDRGSLEQQMQQAGLQLGGGGLDLQHGRLPMRDPEEEAGRLARLATEPAAEDASAESAAPPRPRSDSLIDLIA